MTATKAAMNVPVGRSETPKKGRKQPIRPEPIKKQVLSALVNGITDLRDRAIVTMLIESGIRVSELVSLNRWSIVQEGADVGIGDFRAQKSMYNRQFRVHRATVKAVREYLSTERAQDSFPALFVDKRGNRLTSHFLRAMVYRWCNTLGVERISIRRFRPDCAMRLVNGGVSMDTLYRLMGYSGQPGIRRIGPLTAELITEEYVRAMDASNWSSST